MNDLGLHLIVLEVTVAGHFNLNQNPLFSQIKMD